MLRTLLPFVLLIAPLVAEEPAVDRKSLKNGLVSRGRLEPTVALVESLSHDETWTGYIQIVTPGGYTFSANLEMVVLNITLTKDGKTISAFRGEAERRSALVHGPQLVLDQGFYRFEAIAKRVPDNDNDAKRPQKVELLWEGPGFAREPVPYFFFGHLPSQRGERFNADLQLDHGKFIFEEHGCANCHTPPKGVGFEERTGPDLSKIGARVYPGWLDAWLADPAKLRPHTTMPKMFANSEQGVAERYAVGQYLLSHGGPMPDFKPSKIDSNYSRSLENGKALFSTAGCAACHGTKLAGTMKRNDDDDAPPPFDPTSSFYGLGTATGAQAVYALGGLGTKTTPEELAKFLKDPLKTNAHGRMPAMGLTSDEARDIARHLMRYTEESIADKTKVPEPKLTPQETVQGFVAGDIAINLKGAKPGDQWREVGSLIFTAKGCANCHTMREKETPVAARKNFPDLARIASSTSDACKGVTYSLTTEQQKAIAAFTKVSAKPTVSDTSYYTRAALKRFNCLNCHMKDGEGGLGNELADAMKKLESTANEDDVQPPRLTGIGHKATAKWLEGVLLDGERARPWMGLRMPQYGVQNVGMLVWSLPQCEGVRSQDLAQGKVRASAATIEMGRKLVGKDGLGCAACHDIGGYPGSGTRGPDLATIDRRVNASWYARWMHNPQRLAPGTKMPSNFTDGKSVSNLLNGDANAQIQAIWAYLALGPGLPLPSGLEPPGKGLPLVAKGKPEILRTFMPDGSGTRPIAVGFPDGAGSYVFDSHAARIVYAWEGNFLDVAPVWNNRGGNAAKLLGPKYLTEPAGQPWLVNDGETPDFEKRAPDYAYGAAMPFGEFFKGPMRVHFEGYSTDTAGVPSFRYSVEASDGKASVTVSDTPTPLRGTVASGLQRNFVVSRPAGKTVWLLVAAGEKPPRTVGKLLVLPQAKERALAVSVAALPKDAEWKTLPGKEGQLLVLKLPPVNDPSQSQLTYSLWSLPRDDDALLAAIK